MDQRTLVLTVRTPTGRATEGTGKVRMQQYVAPDFNETAYNCPHCGAYTHQEWVELYVDRTANKLNWPINFPKAVGSFANYTDVAVSVCFRCKMEAIWHTRRMVYPDFVGVDLPNPDLADDIRADYLEAASIVQRSPRGAAALLRLCIQKLCKQLKLPGKDINADIKTLVQRGLPEEIQQALDIVRVVGNEAVHPGVMDLKDDTATAMKLFELVNFIAEDRISRPKRVAALYQSLPERKLAGIEQRDKKQP